MLLLRPLAFAALFLLLGLPFLPVAGIHVDAAYELSCFYPCALPLFSANMLGSSLPLMVITYLGAFKAWLFQPIIMLGPVGPYLLRLPTLLIASSTVVMFFFLLKRTISTRAAVIGTALLATDVSFVLSSAYDFGPVVLLHAILLAGALLLLRFHHTEKTAHLVLAFFLFGLAMWTKALFIWVLTGLTLAAAVTFPKRLLATLSARRAGYALAAFCLGAVPLLYFNIATLGATARLDAVIAPAYPFSEKATMLKRTLDGSALQGFIAEETQPATAREPSGWLARMSVRINRALGDLWTSWNFYLLAATILLVPWLWQTPARRAALFCMVFLIVTWLQMALTPKTGSAVHHTILLWPFPQFLIALAADQLCTRFGSRATAVVSLCIALAAGRNVLLLNEYYADLVTKGTTAIWSDAVDPLMRYMRSLGPRRYIASDWGYSATLCLLSKGQMPIDDIARELIKVSEPDVPWIRSLIGEPRVLFIGHPEGQEMFKETQQHLDDIAAREGYRRRIVKVISDRNQRPRFTVFRYSPQPDPEPGTVASAIATGNAVQEDQLSGFHEIEHKSWRWTSQSFSAALAWPGKGPARLLVELHVPPALLKQFGPVTLEARTGKNFIGSQLYTATGDYRFERPMPRVEESPVTITFSLDKYFYAGQLDGRELGIIVKTISLVPL